MNRSVSTIICYTFISYVSSAKDCLECKRRLGTITKYFSRILPFSHWYCKLFGVLYLVGPGTSHRRYFQNIEFISVMVI